MSNIAFKKIIFGLCVLFLCGGAFCVSSENSESGNVSVSEKDSEQTINLYSDPEDISINLNRKTSATSSDGGKKSYSVVFVLIKMVLALVVVAGIIYGVFYLLKKSVKSVNDNDPFLRKVSQITLTPGKTVQIVTLQDNAYILGVSDQSINLIGKVEDRELVNAMNLYADKSSGNSKPKSFSEILNIFMPGSSKNTTAEEKIGEDEDAMSFIRAQNQRLEQE